MKIALSFSVLLIATMLNAECKVNYLVMYTLATNERNLKRDVGYPYLISFNSQKERKKVVEKLNLEWIDNRTLDCKSLSECRDTLKTVNQMGITNLDLGGYQFHQNSYPFSDSDEYFDLKKSYKNACNKVYKHYLETRDWSWYTIARYHSKTPSFNKKYAQRLERNYNRIIKQKKEKS